MSREERKVALQFAAPALVVLALIVAACGASPATPTAAPTDTPAAAGVQLRVKNNGPTPIQGLVVMFPEDRVVLGDVAPGATTEYVLAPHGVYRYAAYQMIIDGQEVTQPVIDWMGEEPVPGTKFTYVLDFDPARQYEKIILVQASVDE